MGGVLGKPPVSPLAITEEVLERVKWTFNCGPDACLGMLDPFHQVAPCRTRPKLALAGPHGDIAK